MTQAIMAAWAEVWAGSAPEPVAEGVLAGVLDCADARATKAPRKTVEKRIMAVGTVVKITNYKVPKGGRR